MATSISFENTSESALSHVLHQVLGYGENHPIYFAFEAFEINNVDDFLMVQVLEDLKDVSFAYPDPDDPSKKISATLSVMQLRKLQLLQEWFLDQIDQSVDTWFELTADIFRIWATSLVPHRNNSANNISTSFGPSTPVTTSSPIQNSSIHGSDSEAALFKKGVKRSVSDYNKFKDDTKWKQWKRHLKAMANSHGTSSVLDPDYVPSTLHEAELFKAQNDFMYSVFEYCLMTSKSKLQIQMHEEDMDAQKVYEGLLNSYENDLSGELKAGDLRSELTILQLNNNWRSGYESFLNMWSTKILELERTQDKEVDPETKRLWLTNTLETQSQMKSAIDQAIITESTLSGLNGSSSTKLPWENFFALIMNQAKLADRQHKIKSNSNREVNNSNRNNSQGKQNNTKKQSNSSDISKTGSKRQWTKYTGSDMEMKPDMVFKRKEYLKLTQAQKKQLKEVKEKAKTSGSPVTTVSSQYAISNTSVTPQGLSQPEHSDTSIRQLLSNRASRTSDQQNVNFPSQPVQEIMYGDHKYRLVNMSKIFYHVSNHMQVDHQGSLIDGGANGGLAGSDMRLLEDTLQKVDVTGIADNTLSNLKVSTVAALIQSTKGPIIGIFHQYAYIGAGKSIHSNIQLKSFGIEIDDTPRKLKGSQCVKHPDGYIIPLSIQNGLAYMDIMLPTDDDMELYPHVIFTSDTPWAPEHLDNEFSVNEIDVAEEDNCPAFGKDEISNFGDFILQESYKLETVPFEDYVDKCIFTISEHKVKPKDQDFSRLRPNFGFIPEKRIQKTLENTTQFCRQDTRFPLRKHFKTRFPAANVNRLNEVVATDTFFSDLPAFDDGILGHGGTTEVQLFCGTTSLFASVHPMKSESDMPNALLDFIRKYGAPNALFSDNAKAQTSKMVKQILRMYAIDDFQCEPHHQHQNPAERQIQDVKRMSNTLMDRTGTPGKFWLLNLQYTVYIINRLSTESLSWKTPIETAFGQKPDISAILAFRWWEPIYFSYGNTFPQSKERTGWIVGIAEHQGDAMTWLILDDLSQRVLARSAVRTALDLNLPNLRAEETSGLNTQKQIKSTYDIVGNNDLSTFKLPKFSPEELLGVTFLREMENGEKYRAQVVRKILDNEALNHERIKFLVSLGDGEFDEIITYNDLSAIIEDLQEREIKNPDSMWSFVEIKEHIGPLHPKHPK